MSALLPALWPALFDPLAKVDDVQFDQSGPPPEPPGPLDRLLPGAADLVNYSTSYTSVTGLIVVRVAFINNAASVPTMTASWDSAPMFQIGLQCDPVIGAPGVAAFYIRGGSTGAKTLAIQCSSGSAGTAAVRIGDLLTLDATTPLGVIGTTDQQAGYYVEVDASSGQFPGSSLVATIACFNNLSASPISTSYSDTEQWTTDQAGMAARFAYAPSPSGESGLNLYVFYAWRSPAGQQGAAMIFELHGASVSGE